MLDVARGQKWDCSMKSGKMTAGFKYESVCDPGHQKVLNLGIYLIFKKFYGRALIYN